MHGLVLLEKIIMVPTQIKLNRIAYTIVTYALTI